MRSALPPAVLCLAAACSTQPVRLYELREAPAGSAAADAYARLEEAVALANRFLASPAGSGVLPGRGAELQMDHTDLLLRLEGEGIYPLRLEAAGFLDPRTAFGHHYTRSYGVLSEASAWRREGRPRGAGRIGPEMAEPAPEPLSAAAAPPRSTLLEDQAQQLAAALLSHAAAVLEAQGMGEFGYTANSLFFAVFPERGGAGSGNPVTARAETLEQRFQRWLETEQEGQTGGGDDPGDQAEGQPKA